MSRTLPVWAAILAMVLSGLDALPSLVASAGRSGMQWASPFAALVIVAALRACATDPALRRRMAPLVVPLALFVGAALLSAAWAEEPRRAFLWGLRIALVGGLALGALTLDRSSLRRAATKGAAVWIGASALLWCVTLALPATHGTLFETGPHQHIGALNRFRGLTGSPTIAGETLLVSVALIQGLGGRTRGVLTFAGLSLAALSWSIVTLAVPLGAILCISHRRVRRGLALGWVVASLSVLYVNPLSVSVGDVTYETGRLHPSFEETGQGRVHTPIRTLSVGSLSLRFHPSHYWQCVVGNVRCAADHPVVGVGGFNFQISCPVTTMDSYGTWVTGRRPHNQYLGILSQHGLLGALAALLLGLAIVRATGRTLSPLERGLLWAYLFCGLQGDVLYQYPFAVWMGCRLQLRGPPE